MNSKPAAELSRNEEKIYQTQNSKMFYYVCYKTYAMWLVNGIIFDF